jgi:hypothetical protein
VASLRNLSSVKTLSSKDCNYHLLSASYYSQYQKTSLSQDYLPARAASPNKSPSFQASRSPLSVQKWLGGTVVAIYSPPCHSVLKRGRGDEGVHEFYYTSTSLSRNGALPGLYYQETLYPRVIITSLIVLILQETQDIGAVDFLVLSTAQNLRQSAPKEDFEARHTSVHMQ